MKSLKIGAVLAFTAALVAGCGSGSSGGSSTKTAGQGSKAFVVLVTDINQLNDHGFNQLAYQGLLRAEKRLLLFLGYPVVTFRGSKGPVCGARAVGAGLTGSAGRGAATDQTRRR